MNQMYDNFLSKREKERSSGRVLTLTDCNFLKYLCVSLREGVFMSSWQWTGK